MANAAVDEHGVCRAAEHVGVDVTGSSSPIVAQGLGPAVRVADAHWQQASAVARCGRASDQDVRLV